MVLIREVPASVTQGYYSETSKDLHYTSFIQEHNIQEHNIIGLAASCIKDDVLAVTLTSQNTSVFGTFFMKSQTLGSKHWPTGITKVSSP